MQHRRQRFHAVNEPRARTHHHGVGVDCPNLGVTWKEFKHPASLSAGLLESEAARRDHDDVGLRLRDRFPSRGDRSFTGASEYRITPRGRHEIGYPVSGAEGRIDPFQDEDSAPGKCTDGCLNIAQATSQRGDEIDASLRDVGRGSNRRNRVENFRKRLRVNLEHVGVTVEAPGRRFDVAARYRAHAAQVLAQDEIGIASLQRRIVERVEVESRVESLTNELIDLAGRHRGICERSHHNLSPVLDAMGPIALGGDTHQFDFET